ncbi:Uncharacterised protein [Yersinia rohdei]|nr:hypothetical protein [Yersinia rohdei]CNE69568.1 Uncharacterised protein [Yersinia rohdei]
MKMKDYSSSIALWFGGLLIGLSHQNNKYKTGLNGPVIYRGLK